MAKPDLATEHEVTDEPDNVGVVGSSESYNDETAAADSPPAKERRRSPMMLAMVTCCTTAVALSGLVGSLMYRNYQQDHVDALRPRFLEVGRQAALNLTTIDYAKADKDVARIVDASAGQFLNDFRQRSQALIDVVRQAKSKSVGTVSEAGVESITGDQAQILVAVQVKTVFDDRPAQQPRGWRMRIDVQKVGDDLKVTNVAFVA